MHARYQIEVVGASWRAFEIFCDKSTNWKRNDAIALVNNNLITDLHVYLFKG